MKAPMREYSGGTISKPTVAVAALCAAVLAGLLSGLASGQEREAERSSGPDELSRPLAALAAGKSDPKTLRVEAVWFEGGVRSSARLFGSGVGIWNERVQIRLSRADVLSIAKALRAARFGSMPGQLGEETEPLSIRGKILVSAGGGTKEVVLLADRDGSETFSKLASKILDLSRERAKAGVTASSLGDALAKLRSGDLAPEALRVIAHRKPEHPDAATRGWLLQLEGRRALARPFAPSHGYGNPKRAELSEAEARTLMAVLSESDLPTLPSNLHAPCYTEVRIEVLQWSRDLLARRSPDVTAQTHGDRQRAFDGVVELLGKLEQRVEKEGRVEKER